MMKNIKLDLVFLVAFFLFAGCGGGDSVRDSLIKTLSSYDCHQDSDCMLSGFTKIPTTSDECCDSVSWCQGVVVNTQEAALRTNAYNTYCPGGCPILVNCTTPQCQQEPYCEQGKCAVREVSCRQ